MLKRQIGFAPILLLSTHVFSIPNVGYKFKSPIPRLHSRHKPEYERLSCWPELRALCHGQKIFPRARPWRRRAEGLLDAAKATILLVPPASSTKLCCVGVLSLLAIRDIGAYRRRMEHQHTNIQRGEECQPRERAWLSRKSCCPPQTASPMIFARTEILGNSQTAPRAALEEKHYIC